METEIVTNCQETCTPDELIVNEPLHLKSVFQKTVSDLHINQQRQHKELADLRSKVSLLETSIIDVKSSIAEIKDHISGKNGKKLLFYKVAVQSICDYF